MSSRLGRSEDKAEIMFASRNVVLALLLSLIGMVGSGVEV